ncbi:adhesion G protein-coupled receptor E2-like [Saccostrea echinata]|uniref:adhesion G protein-coupled receptor E2-like n=1 Tax=Saccostrea echinata TaxID=191078 RepID=UPI002A81CFFA|nr:adhesion G protein-coupled receptor E2-like [Saccostrea echinata]
MCFDKNFGRSTIGCDLKSTDNLYLNCECNHLTNFAVLVRPYSTTQDKEKALSWISLIGCSFSAFFSLLTEIVYIVLWKSITCDVSRMVNYKITVFLCLSIAMAYTIFLLRIDKIQYKIGCFVITALLQYLFLFVFFLILLHFLNQHFKGLFIFISKCLLSRKIRKLLCESIHKKHSVSWRSRLYSLLSSTPLSMNMKEFSSVSEIKPEGEESINREGVDIKEVLSKSRESVKTVL